MISKQIINLQSNCPPDYSGFLYCFLALVPTQLRQAISKSMYSRITIGSSRSTTDKYQVVDSLTLNVGSELQTGEEFAISSVKLRGNNGVATVIGENSVRISWDAAPSGVAGYSVFRSNSPNGPFDHYVESVTVDKNHCDDTTVEKRANLLLYRLCRRW